MLRNIAMGALVLALGAGTLMAQSNDRLDEILAQDQARLDTTSYLALSAAGLIAEDADPAAAFEAATASGWLPKGAQASDGVSVEALAFLLMKAEKVPGGVVWMVFPNPRTAYRELDYRGLINVSAGPARLVAGDEVVRTLQAVLALKGGRS